MCRLLKLLAEIRSGFACASPNFPGSIGSPGQAPGHEVQKVLCTCRRIREMRAHRFNCFSETDLSIFHTVGVRYVQR